MVAKNDFLPKVIAVLETDRPYVNQSFIMKMLSSKDAKTFNSDMRGGEADDDTWRRQFGA